LNGRVGETACVSSHVAFPFQIRSAVEIIEVCCHISSTGLDQGKIGLLKKANEVIKATSIGVNRFWGLLHLAQKENLLSCILLGGNTRIELPSYLIHVDELLVLGVTLYRTSKRRI
jgi:hypothetical protein